MLIIIKIIWFLLVAKIKHLLLKSLRFMRSFEIGFWKWGCKYLAMFKIFMLFFIFIFYLCLPLALKLLILMLWMRLILLNLAMFDLIGFPLFRFDWRSFNVSLADVALHPPMSLFAWICLVLLSCHRLITFCIFFRLVHLKWTI